MFLLLKDVKLANFRFAIMACCWAASPEERPKIDQLLNCLQRFYGNMKNFV